MPPFLFITPSEFVFFFFLFFFSGLSVAAEEFLRGGLCCAGLFVDLCRDVIV